MQRAIKLRKVYKIMEKQATKITKEPKIPLKKKKKKWVWKSTRNILLRRADKAFLVIYNAEKC